MKRYIKSSRNNSKGNKRRSAQSATSRKVYCSADITQRDITRVLEDFGSAPVVHYFLGSPGWYGYGGYGSDYSIHYWVLEDGRYICSSEYTGSEEFDSEKEMLDDLNRVRDAMIKQVNEMLSEGEIDEQEYDDLMASYESLSEMA